MEFTIETAHTQKAVAEMARVLRKTVRKKRSRRTHIFGWVVIVIGILCTLPLGEQTFTIDFRTIITWLAVLVILLVLFFEDQLNGYIARRWMLTGMERATTVFRDGSYTSTTSVGTTEFPYDRNILLLAETRDYFVFVFDKCQRQ